jgi:2-phosphosulfolactate phosphatase
MEIKILHLARGAREARGLTVVIDVFRAFTTACFVMARGAKTIVPVGDLALALELKKADNSLILMGERKNLPLEGFDFGNSPTLIEKTDFSGRTVVLTTSAGTQGIASALHADEIVTAALVNAKAVASYIAGRRPEKVSLVCMGEEALRESDEDTFCAEYIKSLLERKPLTREEITFRISSFKSGCGKRFFDPANQSFSPERDFGLATSLDIFDFVLIAKDAPRALQKPISPVSERLKSLYMQTI